MSRAPESRRVDRMTAALDLAGRLATGSGCAPTRSVTTEVRLLAFALLDLEGALRAVAAHDRTPVYLPGELRGDGAAPASDSAEDAWATPREIALGLLPGSAPANRDQGDRADDNAR